ncbi:MAG: leucine-rich repeat domain-containing protein [Clostridia bacterium]|nr:leucine-rich repeat domain-containing protein [Clostridia bacterium]
MKKKILLALTLVLLFACLLAIGISAEETEEPADMTQYIEFKVLLEGETEYIPVYLYNNKNNPELRLSDTIYSKLNQTETVDKTKIVKIDMSNAKAHGVSVTYIGVLGAGSATDYANVTEIKFPNQEDGVKEIGGSFCKGWTSLQYIDFGSTQKIKNQAFAACTSLLEVTLPENLTYVEHNLFNGCTSLKEATLLGEITVEVNTFLGCTSLTTVSMEKAKCIAGGMFSGCSSLTEVTIPETATYIGSKAFLETKITSINIPAAVTKIEEKAFQSVTTLTSVTFAENSQLETIGTYVFEKTGLTGDIVLPSSLKTIGDGAFSTIAITSVTFPEGLESIGSSAFASTNITSANIPNGVTAINSSTFKKCANLTSVSIPAGFTLIDDYAFQDCTGITSLEFRGNAGENAVIDQAAFERCYTIGNVYIPEGVTTLGNCAFASAGVTNLSLPTTLTTVNGNSTFNVWGQKNITDDYKLKTVTGLENTKITTIVASMFRGQSQWTPETIILPNTVETIQGDYAFADVGMTNMYLSANLTTLGNEAFTACKNLQNVYIPGTITTIGDNPFKDGIGVYFFVTSDDADYLATIYAKTSSTNDIVKYEDYIKDPSQYENGKYVISGCNVCDTFYNGVHDKKAELTYGFSGDDYISPFCSYAGCNRCPKTEETELIDPLFIPLGYSKSEDAFMYDIKVDYTAVEEYKTFFKNTFGQDVNISYGLVVSGDESLTTLLNADGTVVNNGVLKVSLNDTSYSKIRVKLNGIKTDENKALRVHTCAYVIVDGEVSYVGDGTVSKTSTTVCYNDIQRTDE